MTHRAAQGRGILLQCLLAWSTTDAVLQCGGCIAWGPRTLPSGEVGKEGDNNPSSLDSLFCARTVFFFWKESYGFLSFWVRTVWKRSKPYPWLFEQGESNLECISQLLETHFKNVFSEVYCLADVINWISWHGAETIFLFFKTINFIYVFSIFWMYWLFNIFNIDICYEEL